MSTDDVKHTEALDYELLRQSMTAEDANPRRQLRIERDNLAAENARLRQQRDEARETIKKWGEYGWASGQLQRLSDGLAERGFGSFDVNADPVDLAFGAILDLAARAADWQGLAETKQAELDALRSSPPVLAPGSTVMIDGALWVVVTLSDMSSGQQHALPRTARLIPAGDEAAPETAPKSKWYPVECEHGYDHCPMCDARPSTPDEAKPVREEGGEDVCTNPKCALPRGHVEACVPLIGDERGDAWRAGVDEIWGLRGEKRETRAVPWDEAAAVAADLGAAEQRVRDLEQQLAKTQRDLGIAQRHAESGKEIISELRTILGARGGEYHQDAARRVVAELAAIRAKGEALAQRMHDADPLNRRADRVWARELRALLAPTPPDGDPKP